MSRGVRGVEDDIRRSSVCRAGVKDGDFGGSWGMVSGVSAAMRARAARRSSGERVSMSILLVWLGW